MRRQGKEPSHFCLLTSVLFHSRPETAVNRQTRTGHETGFGAREIGDHRNQLTNFTISGITACGASSISQ
jgi:hypothetical protein